MKNKLFCKLVNEVERMSAESTKVENLFDEIFDDFQGFLKINGTMGDILIESASMVYAKSDEHATECADWVSWFLYERPVYTIDDSEEPNVVVDSRGYSIKTVEDLATFLEEVVCV